MKRLAVLLFGCLALASCGLKPLYAPGAAGSDALYRQVEVMPIPGKEGYLVRAELIDQLGQPAAGSSPPYRLQVVLDDDISGVGVRGDNSIARETRTLRARFRMVDLTTNDLVIDATAGSDAGIDVVSSEYATIAAEDRALENLADIVAREIVADISLAMQSRAGRASERAAEGESAAQ